MSRVNVHPVEQQRRLAQTSYITCLPCTVNKCIPDLPRLVLLCACQQCERVKGWSWALLQGETLFTPLTHTKKRPVFTTNLPCISRPNTAALASGGSRGVGGGITLLYSSRGHRQSVTKSNTKMDLCWALISSHIVSSRAPALSPSLERDRGGAGGGALRFSGCGRQYWPLVLFPSNAAQGLCALRPRSPLNSQSSGGAVLLGKAGRWGAHSPQQLGTIATSPPLPMLGCQWKSVSVLGLYFYGCEGLRWEGIQKTPVGVTVVM